MPALLAVAVLLLVLVVGLSIIQWRRQRDFSVPTGTRTSIPGPATASPGAVDEESDPDSPFRDDPVLGNLMFDDEGTWICHPDILDECVDEVQVHAGREGPGERHRQWALAAQARGEALLHEAAAKVTDALVRHGLSGEEPILREMHLGEDEHGVFEGRLVFESDDDAVDTLYVRSTDTWRTLEAHVETSTPIDAEER